MIAGAIAAVRTVRNPIKAGLMILLVLELVWGLRVDQLRGRYKAGLATCQAERKIAQANGERDAAQATAGYALAGAAASQTYADRLAAREPIIVQSTNTVREYAQTDAGRAVCRGADRVRAIDELDTALAADPGTAGGSAAAMHPDPAAPPAER